MAITTETPVVVNATFDKVWFSKIEIRAFDLNAQPKANVELVLFRENNGQNEILAGSQKRFQINDLFTLAQTDIDVANAMGALFIALEKVAKERKLI